MNKLITILFIFSFSAVASAKSSVCVLYADNSASPVQSQYSCDGADLANLYTASGVSAVISKSIPYFLDKGYNLTNCSEANADGGEHGTDSAYVRCTLVMK